MNSAQTRASSASPGAAGTANDSHTALMSKNRATRIRNRFRLRFFARPGQSRLAANRPKSNIIVGMQDEFDTFVSSLKRRMSFRQRIPVHRGARNPLTGMALSLLLDVDLALQIQNLYARRHSERDDTRKAAGVAALDARRNQPAGLAQRQPGRNADQHRPADPAAVRDRRLLGLPAGARSIDWCWPRRSACGPKASAACGCG